MGFIYQYIPFIIILFLMGFHRKLLLKGLSLYKLWSCREGAPRPPGYQIIISKVKEARSASGSIKSNFNQETSDGYQNLVSDLRFVLKSRAENTLPQKVLLDQLA